MQRYLPTFLFENQFDDAHEAIRQLYGALFENKELLILAIREGRKRCGGTRARKGRLHPHGPWRRGRLGLSRAHHRRQVVLLASALEGGLKRLPKWRLKSRR